MAATLWQLWLPTLIVLSQPQPREVAPVLTETTVAMTTAHLGTRIHLIPVGGATKTFAPKLRYVLHAFTHFSLFFLLAAG
jgi:hypothetical protein